MRAHFFDLDTLLQIESKVWIVDKSNPNIPIIKISRPEFNLIRQGIYKSQKNLIHFSGDDYWLPTDLFNKLKIKAKNYKVNFSNLAFSLQEFMNTEILENLDYKLNLKNIRHVKNTDDDIYVICSKNNKRSYQTMISKIEDQLKENGLQIKNYYFISETFYNRNEDDISHKKVRLILQHLIGRKTQHDKFTDDLIKGYDEVFFYDTDSNSTESAKKINMILEFLLSNTEVNIKSKIKDELKNKEHLLYINYVTHNDVNRFVQDKVLLELNNVIKTFERFKWNY